MAAQLHAADYGTFKEKLQEDTIPNLLQRYQDPGAARYQAAELPEDRAILMSEYANDVFQG